MTRILCIGEVMAEIRSEYAGFAVGFAGDTFNTAVYCRRSLRHGNVAYLTRIGVDPLSAGFLRLAKAERVDLTHIGQEADRNIGIYSVLTDPKGERSFSYWRSTSAARRLFQSEADFEALNGMDVIYLSGITLAILDPGARDRLFVALERAKTVGAQIAFDSNYRPRLWPDADTARQTIRRAWALADIGLPSADDEMALFGDSDDRAVIDRLRQWGLQNGALKRGALGPLPINADVTLGQYEPATRVVDTTAAGDSFNGGFLAALANGGVIAQAMDAGHALARLVVGQPGAIIPLGGDRESSS